MIGGGGAPNWLTICLSCITHILLLAPAIYIIVLAAQVNYSLFVWHPTCLSVGCGLLMAEAVLGISGERSLATRISRAGRIRMHWVLHFLGLTLLVIGFGVIVANKIRNGSPHFTSDHGRLGLSTFIISLIVALGGVMTLYSGLLSQSVSLATTKLVHGCGGVICMILLLATLITGLYRAWWPGSSTGRGLAVAAYVIGGIIVLARPLYTSLIRIRGLFT